MPLHLQALDTGSPRGLLCGLRQFWVLDISRERGQQETLSQSQTFISMRAGMQACRATEALHAPASFAAAEDSLLHSL